MAGLPPACRIELTMPMSTQDGIRGLDQVLQRQPLTDAIFFSADSLALPALLECIEQELAAIRELENGPRQVNLW